MRRLPYSWDKTLAALGFRRNVARIKRDHYTRKRSQFEPLEVRAMLSGNQPQYSFVVEDDAEYDPASQFFLSTEYDPSTSAPRAVLALRHHVDDEQLEIGLQEIELELVDDGTVLQSQVILVDIAEEEFLEEFRAERLVQVEETLSAEIADGSGVAAGDYSLEDLLDIEAFETGRQDGTIGEAVAAGFYEAYRLALADAAYREENALAYEEFEAASNERHALSSAAVLLTGRLLQDASSSDPQLASAAFDLRGSLFEHGELAHTTFAGLGVNQEIVREARLGGTQEFVIALVEEPAFEASFSLRVELSGAPAMVQAAITNLGIASASSQSSATVNFSQLEDVSIKPGVTPDPSLDFLSAERVGGVEEHALLWFDLAGLDHELPEEAKLVLTPTNNPAGVSQSVSAHWDAWGITTPDKWSSPGEWGSVPPPQYTWADYDPDIRTEYGDEQGLPLDTQVVSGNGTKEFTITTAVQRALLAGDSNLDGKYESHFGLTENFQRSDIEAAYMAVRNPDRYAEIYGQLEVIPNGLLYRNDIDWDGDVDNDDFKLIAHRLGFKAGDFNLDGTVDIKDYSIWQENHGRETTIFQHGDANADGRADSADYTVWKEAENETHDPLPTTKLALRITPDANSDGVVTYASAEEGVLISRPFINTTGDSELLLTGFTPNDQLGWTIDYDVLN